MSSSIDDVEGWDRHNETVRGFASQISQVLVKRQVVGGSSGAGSSQRNGKDGIGADLLLAPAPLVLSSINLFNHLAVDLLLLSHIHTLEGRAEDLVDIFDRLEASLSKEALGVLVSELEGLINTCRST